MRCEGLRRLELASLALDWSHRARLVNRPRSWDPNLYFIDMPGGIIEEFYALVQTSFAFEISYTRCSMEHPGVLGDSGSLELIEIESPTALVNFLGAAQDGFSGYEVSFINCNGLLPEVLLTLARPWRGEDVWLSPEIVALTFKRPPSTPSCLMLLASHFTKPELLQRRQS